LLGANAFLFLVITSPALLKTRSLTTDVAGQQSTVPPPRASGTPGGDGPTRRTDTPAGPVAVRLSIAPAPSPLPGRSTVVPCLMQASAAARCYLLQIEVVTEEDWVAASLSGISSVANSVVAVDAASFLHQLQCCLACPFSSCVTVEDTA